MLTSIRTYDELGNYLLKLPVVENDSSSPYKITNITGIGPVPATIANSTYAGLDGAILQATRVGVRNLVLTIGYRPDYQSNHTIQNLRRDLYKYFAPKSEVRLRFYQDDYSDMTITGTVESHEPKMFSEDPEVVISIMCEDPYFKAIKATEINSYNNTPVYPSFVGEGSAGFKVEVFVNRSISSISLESAPNAGIVCTTPMVAGDILEISTVRGRKYARLTRDGDTTSVLDAISGSLSMQLSPLSSNFYVRASGASNIPFRLTYTAAFVGV